MIEQIRKSLLRTKLFPVNEFDYPDKHGIYGFVLVGNNDLGDFGKRGTIVYIPPLVFAVDSAVASMPWKKRLTKHIPIQNED